MSVVKKIPQSSFSLTIETDLDQEQWTDRYVRAIVVEAWDSFVVSLQEEPPALDYSVRIVISPSRNTEPAQVMDEKEELRDQIRSVR